MPRTILLKLVRPARKAGGDRYEATIEGGEQLVIYFPQCISRVEGIPLEKLKVTVEDK